MSISNSMMIAITEAKYTAEAENGNLVAKLTAAMKITKNHWLITNEDEQIRAAIGAVMLIYGKNSTEYMRLEAEINNIQKISTMISAIDLGLSTNLDIVDLDISYEPIGIIRLWNEIKSGK